MTKELIGIREAARRLGVSDTAVHKAIKAGRVKVASKNEKNNRPLLAWPDTKNDWEGNSDPAKRTHVGGTGKSPARAKYAAEPPVVVLPVRPSSEEKQAPAPAEPARAATETIASQPDEPIRQPTGPSYAQSRAVREAYQARLAKLDYEERSGKLVEIDKVKASAFKVARTIRDGLLNLPDRVAHELAHETDAAAVHMRLTQEIRVVLEALAAPGAA